MSYEKRTGFTLLELMIVVSVIGLLTILALPSFSKPRTTTLSTHCISNQRVIFGAVNRYELDNRASLYSIRNNTAAIRQTLVTNQYVRLSASFNCPTDNIKSSADYRLIYANSTTFTNTMCLMARNLHVLP